MASTEEIVQEIRATYVRLKQAQARAHEAHEHYLDGLKEAYSQRLREIEAAFEQSQEQVQAAYQEQVEEAAAAFEVGQLVQTQMGEAASAFRWTMAGWDDPAWSGYAPVTGAPIPSCVRIGRLRLDGAEDLLSLPALAPLLGQGHLFIAGSDEDSPAARRLLQTIVLRLLVSFPPGVLRLSLADPVGLGANLSAFLRLPDALRSDKVCSRPDEIQRQLNALATHIENVLQTRLLNLYASVEEYNEQVGEIAVPYHVLALADFPAGFDDRMAGQLLDIARNGPRAGVYVVATLNPSYPPPRDFDLADLEGLGTRLALTAPDRLTWNDPEFGGYPVVPDSLPEATRINRWLDAVGLVAQQTPVSLPFRRVAIPESERWAGNTTDGLQAPIGVGSTGETLDFQMGQGVVHHGLIGGTIGSGKSNLLHVLITQMALRYAPEEIEMYLVDFREGVEFQDYLTLPHARAVALESEREFGLSVLRRLQAEMQERGRLYKERGVGSNEVPIFRRQTGRVLPRILLVMDEFQVLFREDDRLTQEAGRLLEDIVRRGRGFGLHVLLSSQSPSVAGIYGNRIYNQMGLRIAFRCRAQDAQAILGEGNDDADRLERPGEAIYNDDMGHKEKNRFVRVAHLPNQERQRYLAAIHSLAKGRPYPAPVTFEGRAPARLEDNPELLAALSRPDWLAAGEPVPVWLGAPIEIKPPTAATLERYLRSNLLIVGGDEAEAHGLLLAALLSLAAQRSPDGAAFYVADFARPRSPFAGLFARLAGARGQESLPQPLTVAGRRQAQGVLAQLVATLDRRLSGEDPADRDLYFFVAGLQRWRDLRGSDPYLQSEAAKQLTRLADEGPELGLHLIAWADGFATLERILKRGGVGHFDLRGALRMPEKDSNDLLGSNAAARLEDNRAFFRNEDWELGHMEKFKPYALPEAAALAGLIQKLRLKGEQQHRMKPT